MNFLLILPDWYCRKLGLTDLPSHDGKLTSDRKMICNPYQSYKIENSDYCNHFSVIFETTSKFVIVFIRLLLERVGVDGFTGQQQKIDVSSEPISNQFWRVYYANRDYCIHFWLNFQATSKFVIVSGRLILPKVGVDGLTGHDGKVTSDKKMICNSY